MKALPRFSLCQMKGKLSRHLFGDCSSGRNRNDATKKSMRRIAITAVSLLSLFLILFVWEYQRRRGFYWYNVQQDYEFNFAGDKFTRLPVEISSDGFVCPEVDGAWDTALLRISVSSGLSALWFEPSIAIESDSHNPKSRQYF